MMQPKNLAISVLIILLLTLVSLGCADNPTEPELTEEDVTHIVAEELAKMQDAKDDTLSPQEIAQITLRSTVYLRIQTQKKNYYGSGFVVGEGLIATCEHVIEGMVSGTAESVFDKKKYLLTKILAISEKHDLAVVRVEGFTAPPLPLGDGDTVRIGERVYAIGNPLEWKGNFSQGIIGGIRPNRNSFVSGKIFHMSTPVSEGSSGGPVMSKDTVFMTSTF